MRYVPDLQRRVNSSGTHARAPATYAVRHTCTKLQMPNLYPYIIGTHPYELLSSE